MKPTPRPIVCVGVHPTSTPPAADSALVKLARVGQSYSAAADMSWTRQLRMYEMSVGLGFRVDAASCPTTER